MQNVNMQSVNDNIAYDNTTNKTDNIPTNSNERKMENIGFKDKYSAISFAGNEVIYHLGKLWKTYKD